MNKQLIKLYADRLRSELSNTEISNDLPSLQDLLTSLPPDEFTTLQLNQSFQSLMWCIQFDRGIEPAVPEKISELEVQPVDVNSVVHEPAVKLNCVSNTTDNLRPFRLPDPSASLSLIQITPDMDRFVRQLYNNTCSPNSSIKLTEKDPRLQEILDLSEEQVAKIPNVGRAKVEQWKTLKSWYSNNQQANTVYQREANPELVESDPLHPYCDDKALVVSDTGELESILLTDIDDFIGMLSERDASIIKQRWGYTARQVTLEEIGKTLEVTRERIRQIESGTNRKLQSGMRLSESTIWQVIEQEKKFRLPDAMPKLFDRFHKEKNFFNFIKMICGNDIPTMVNAGVTDDVLNGAFIEAGAPLTSEQIQHVLRADEFCKISDSEIADINTFLDYLEQRGMIIVSENGVSPTHLGKNEAVACVLSRYAEGLPWEEITEKVNEHGLCKTPLSTERKDGQAFLDSELVYLSGQRLHSHLKYIDFENIDLDAICQVVKKYIHLSDRDVIHLNEIHQSAPDLHEYDYYIVRYVVKMFGEGSGIYFQGKSRTDSVSLEKNFENVSQIDVILSQLKLAGKPMSRMEITDLLMSKSQSHASLYLTGLVKDGRVVKVDNLFTVPELAFKSVSTDEYAELINKLLESSGLPSDISWLTSELNTAFGKDHIPSYYTSIIRMHTQKKHWFMARSLVSLEPIIYTSLAHAMEMHCDFSTNWQVNKDAFRKHINIDTVAANTLFAQLLIQREKRNSDDSRMAFVSESDEVCR